MEILDWFWCRTDEGDSIYVEVEEGKNRRWKLVMENEDDAFLAAQAVIENLMTTIEPAIKASPITYEIISRAVEFYRGYEDVPFEITVEDELENVWDSDIEDLRRDLGDCMEEVELVSDTIHIVTLPIEKLTKFYWTAQTEHCASDF